MDISRHSDSKLASIVSFGGPPQELFDGNLVMQLGVKMAPWSRGLIKYHRLACKMNSMGAWPAVLPQMHLIWNYDNVDADTARLAAHAVTHCLRCFGAVPAGCKRGVLTNTWRPIAIQMAGQGSVPIFLLRSQRPARGTSLMRRVDEGTVQRGCFRVLSRANGYSHDYGHVDMLLGLTAADEVLPLLVDWLEERAMKASGIVGASILALVFCFLACTPLASLSPPRVSGFCKAKLGSL